METETVSKNYSTEIPPLEKPFENIALAFSGGGFRAATFALGVLSYFDQVNMEDNSLLQHVTYISSASGGTITSAMYALYNSRQNKTHKENFKEFYVKVVSELQGSKLLEKVFAILNSDKEWGKKTNKRRNIINAFALAYDDLLFDHQLVSDIKNGESSSTLEEVCFNTTEFHKGLLFRQAIKLKPDLPEGESFLFGNYIVHVSHEAANQLKLADLLAASSCFPAGFEPLIFPDDFVHPGNSKRALLDSTKIEPQELKRSELEFLYGKEQITSNSSIFSPVRKLIALLKLKKDNILPLQSDFKFGLMDGGIADNQGLESMIRANERRINRQTDFKAFDFMMVNDVGSHFMEPYTLSDKRKSYSGISAITLDSVMLISTILTILGFAGIIFGLFFATDLCYLRSSLFAGTTLFLVFGGITGLIFFTKKFIIGEFPNGSGLNLRGQFSQNIMKNMFNYFGATPVRLILNMLRERGKSILILNSSVFLKRIRQLLYQRFFESGKLTNRVKSNHIYDLSYTNDRNRYDSDFTNKLAPQFDPSDSMQIVAESAFRVPTTLWFDDHKMDESKQADVIACGQFSTCYNLLEYITRLNNCQVKFSEEYTLKLQKIELQLRQHYLLFKQDPYWLANQLGTEYKIPNWKNAVSANLKVPKEFEGLRP